MSGRYPIARSLSQFCNLILFASSHASWSLICPNHPCAFASFCCFESYSSWHWSRSPLTNVTSAFWSNCRNFVLLSDCTSDGFTKYGMPCWGVDRWRVYGAFAVSKTKEGAGGGGEELLNNAGIIVNASNKSTGRSWYSTEELPCRCCWAVSCLRGRAPPNRCTRIPGPPNPPPKPCPNGPENYQIYNFTVR